MSDSENSQETPGSHDRQPILLLPGVVTALAAVIVAAHLVRVLLFNDSGLDPLVLWGGFLPLRLLLPEAIPGGWLPLLWTPFTHGFLHGGWEHLLFNVAWLAIFGTPVARRYGPGPTLAVFLVCTAAGAAAFAAVTIGDGAVLVGASGGIAGLTGAAMRFVFQPVITTRHPETGEVIVLGRRLASFSDLWRNTRSRYFILIWVVLNAAVPLFPLFTGGAGVQIAWQAHLGGFFVGLLLVPLFERREGAG
ncbi:MAG TPA: rhomboid family intramembrane serine protease [Devosiaceae bacterium]|nr:rhomboid family intramembrane serine protease [Devosiaceae bacterium]